MARPAPAASSSAASPASFLTSRVARRIRLASISGYHHGDAVQSFDPEQHFLETALRSRSARQIRTRLRRMTPVWVTVPRWSQAVGYFEEIALDLAVGEPAIGCRTVGCRPLKHRSEGEAWSFLLQVFGQLGRGGDLLDGSATAADRKGFRWGLEQVLEDAHQGSRHRLAVLMHGVEHLPVEVLSDLVTEWSAYRERHPEGVRVALLLAGAERPRWLELPDLHEITLEDYSEAETIAALVQRCGQLPPGRARTLARFTGGIPEVVEAVAERLQGGADVRDVEQLLQELGGVGDQMRGVIDIVAARGELADRLAMLADGKPHTEWLDTDTPLMEAGLIRRVRAHGLPHVALRARALCAMVG